MRLFHTSRAVMIVLMVLGFGSLSTGAEKDKTTPDKGVMHTIDARVTYSSGTSAGTNVLAERQPRGFDRGSSSPSLPFLGPRRHRRWWAPSREDPRGRRPGALPAPCPGGIGR